MTNTPQDIAIEPIIEWIRNNYQDHSIDSLCEELRAQWFERRFDTPAAPAHPQVAAVVAHWPTRLDAEEDDDDRTRAFKGGYNSALSNCEHAGISAFADKMRGTDIEKAIDTLIQRAWAWGQSCEVDGIAFNEKGDSHNEWLRSEAQAVKQKLLAASAAVVPKAQAEAVGVREQLTVGVASTDKGATVCINQHHTDGTTTVVYLTEHPLGDTLGRFTLTPAPQAREPAEPVAWMMRWTGHAPSVTTDPSDYPTERDQGLLIPLYAAPSQAEPAQPHPCSLSATGDSNG